MIKAILTGHSKGLGLGIAHALMAQGHPIMGLSRTENTTLQQQFPALLQQIPVDLSNNQALDSLIRGNLLEQFITNTTLLLLINNAGLVTPIGPLSAQNPGDIARSIHLNVTAPMVLSAALAKLLKGKQELRILHVSSGAGRSAYPGWSVYCATKAALDMHAKAVMQDRQANIKICSLAPGVIDTGMQAEIRQSDTALFPNRQRFIELSESGSLASPHATGERIVNYLLSPKFGSHAVDDLRSN